MKISIKHSKGPKKAQKQVVKSQYFDALCKGMLVLPHRNVMSQGTEIWTFLNPLEFLMEILKLSPI